MSAHQRCTKLTNAFLQGLARSRLLDYYLTVPPKDFEAQLPFTIIEKNDIQEEELDDVLPDGQYSKEQLVEYIKSSKEKYHRVIMSSKQGEHPCFIEDAEVGKTNYS